MSEPQEAHEMAEAVGNLIAVTVENFPRAESDLHFATSAGHGGFGEFHHHRDPEPIGQAAGQPAGQAGQKTLCSSAVLDLEAGPAAVTLPDTGERPRPMALLIINQDHYVTSEHHSSGTGAGTYLVLRSVVSTRYAMLCVRISVDPDSAPDDLETAHALQDAIVLEQPGGPGTLDLPAWDPVSQKKVRDALAVLGETLPDLSRAFGSRGEVDPIRHLIASAIAWGTPPPAAP